MEEHRKKYVRIYLASILIVFLLYGLLSYFLGEESSLINIWLLLDLLLAISLVIAIFYIGEKPVKKKDSSFVKFCEFEAKHDRDKVDVIHTYIVTIPSFIYILLGYLYKGRLPRFFISFTSLAVFMTLLSFLGYRICYKNKDYVEES